MKDPFRHFVEAQQWVYEDVIAELEAARKRSHWMWFIFPQLAGLGRSGTSRRFGLGSAADAAAYLAHPLLGPRLLACTSLLLAADTDDPRRILGDIDALKLCSCMTLFHAAAPRNTVFRQVLDRFYGGRQDAKTLEILGRQAQS